MLFIKPDNTPAVSMMTINKRVLLFPPSLTSRLPMKPATPVRANPALMIKIAHTVTTAELLKPDSASAGETNPVIARLTITISAMISIRIHSVMKRNMAIARMTKTVMISGVIIYGAVLPVEFQANELDGEKSYQNGYELHSDK
jgi:hypothetical protein